MTELTSDFFAMLRLAKRLSDSPLSEKAHKRFGFFDLNEDHYYELSYEATTWVFKDTSCYYKEESEVETWVFCDPVIDRFCQLCGQYERRNGLSEDHNRYRKRLENRYLLRFFMAALRRGPGKEENFILHRAGIL